METNNEIKPPVLDPVAQVTPLATTNIVKVNSRVGFAAHVVLAVVWILTYFAANVVYAALAQLFDFGDADVARYIVILVALSVPLVPIYIFSSRRLDRMLAANAGNAEDLNFKKTVRRSLKWAIIFGTIFIAYKVYVVLDVLFLEGRGDAAESIVSLLVYGSALGFIAWYSWSYYNKMRS
jgi:hypothetical protein